MYSGKVVRIIFVAVAMNSLAILQQSVEAASHTKISIFEASYDLPLLIFLFFIIGLALLISKQRKRERKLFTAEVKRVILRKQRNKCAYCRGNPGVLDFDHKDGNRSNNKLSNCVALCPNCHAKKTRGLTEVKKKIGGPVALIVILLIFLLLAAFILSELG